MNFIPESKIFYHCFEDYVKSNYYKPTNPFNNKEIYEYKHNIEKILEIFFELINLDIPEERLINFGVEFKTAFKSYYNARRTEIGKIVNNLNTINIKYEVFLKILIHVKYPNINFWKMNFPKLMKNTFDLNNGFLTDIYKKNDKFWNKKNAVEAMNRYALVNR